MIQINGPSQNARRGKKCRERHSAGLFLLPSFEVLASLLYSFLEFGPKLGLESGEVQWRPTPTGCIGILQLLFQILLKSLQRITSVN
jgi:hypothetical protein